MIPLPHLPFTQRSDRPRGHSTTDDLAAAHGLSRHRCACLRSLHCRLQNIRGGKQRHYFLQAIDKDPSHALAHAGLAAAYNDLGEGEGSPSSETFSKAKAAAARALELDDGLAEGHAELARAVLALDWDWAGAEREFQRALDLNPNSATVRAGYALHLARVGRLTEAISEAKR